MNPVGTAAVPGVDFGCIINLPVCAAGKLGGKAIDKVTDGAWEKIVKGFLEGMVMLLEKLSTFWMKFPDPQITDVTKPEGAMIGPMQLLSDQLSGWVAVCSLVSVVVCCVRAIRQVSARPFSEAAMSVLMVVAVQLGLAGAVQAGLAATSALSESLLATTGKNKSLSGLVSVNDAMSSNQSLAVWFILALLAILSSLMQLMFMLMRGPLIMLLVLWMHFAAATAASDEGRVRAKKVIGLLISFLIYKPAAAAIYALGFMLIYGNGTDGAPSKDAFMNTMYGFMTVLMAAIALPAVIRFIVPLAAATTSNAFSGGAAAGAAIAAGSAVVTMGKAGAATGGSSRAAQGSAVKSTTGRMSQTGTSTGQTGDGGNQSQSVGMRSAPGSRQAAALMGGGSSGGLAGGAQGLSDPGLSKGAPNAIPSDSGTAPNAIPSDSGTGGWGSVGGPVTKTTGANTGTNVSTPQSSSPIPAAPAAMATGGHGQSAPKSQPGATNGSTSTVRSGAEASSGGGRAAGFGSAPAGVRSAYSVPGGVSKGGGTNPAPAAPTPPAAPPRPSLQAQSGGTASESSWRPSGSPAYGQGRGGTTRPIPTRPGGQVPPSRRDQMALPSWARGAGEAGRRMSSSDQLIPPGH
ncbi:hypothetical protein [Calidifontibacter indicus]|uniref:Type IV secretory pathway TrbL component n=1 Tax=Calidifontibacter indicus TaxID=419650 RepID=A0A3D9U578_9MICO|nr:hypothetical protein [Calidifontibacter indicus]REF24652.1 type IV secretory pathway TrbL component [Calidifontibacter indicus]